MTSLNAALFESGEDAYHAAALKTLEPGSRPDLPEWAAETIQQLLPQLIPDEAGERWGHGLTESALIAYWLVLSEDWSSLDRRSIQDALDLSLPALCGEDRGSSALTFDDDFVASVCAKGLVSPHPAGVELVKLRQDFEASPAWVRLESTGLLMSGAIAQLAVADKLLEGTELTVFERADQTAKRIGAAVAFVVVIKGLGIQGTASRPEGAISARGASEAGADDYTGKQGEKELERRPAQSEEQQMLAPEPTPTSERQPRTDYTVEDVWYEMYTAEEHDAKGTPCRVLRACVGVGYPGTVSSPQTHDSWRLIAPGLSEKEIRRQARDELLNLGLNLRSVLPARHRRRMLKLAKTAELHYRDTRYNNYTVG